jgi:hypothetical protein
MCTKCEAKIEFHLKDDQEDKYKMSIKNSQLKHNKDMHPEVLKWLSFIIINYPPPLRGQGS